MATIQADDLRFLLSRCRRQADLDTRQEIPYSARLILIFDVSSDAEPEAIRSVPYMRLISPPDDARRLVQVETRIRQVGRRYRREAIDGSPLLISDGDQAWSFSYPLDSLYVAHDTEPVPHRRRHIDPAPQLRLPPTLPEDFADPSDSISDGVPVDHHGSPAWKFQLTHADERWTATIHQSTGWLLYLQHADSPMTTEWRDIIRNAETDEQIFRWMGPDRSADEAKALREPTA